MATGRPKKEFDKKHFKIWLAIEWNETFGGRWQAVFEGEDSYSDIGNVLAWMPLPEPYTESKAE